jgi:hypothetical protein
MEGCHGGEAGVVEGFHCFSRGQAKHIAGVMSLGGVEGKFADRQGG